MKAILSFYLIKKLLNIIKEEISLKEVFKLFQKDLNEEYYLKRDNYEGNKIKFIQSLTKQIKIIFYLYKFPEGLSRKELENKTQIKRTSIYDNLIKQKKIGVVVVFKVFNKKRGSPNKIWKLNIEKIEYKDFKKRKEMKKRKKILKEKVELKEMKKRKKILKKVKKKVEIRKIKIEKLKIIEIPKTIELLERFLVSIQTKVFTNQIIEGHYQMTIEYYKEKVILSIDKIQHGIFISMIFPKHILNINNLKTILSFLHVWKIPIYAKTSREDLRKLYKINVGNRAIYDGRETRAFKKWIDQRYISRNNLTFKDNYESKPLLV